MNNAAGEQGAVMQNNERDTAKKKFCVAYIGSNEHCIEAARRCCEELDCDFLCEGSEYAGLKMCLKQRPDFVFVNVPLSGILWSDFLYILTRDDEHLSIGICADCHDARVSKDFLAKLIGTDNGSGSPEIPKCIAGGFGVNCGVSALKAAFVSVVYSAINMAERASSAKKSGEEEDRAGAAVSGAMPQAGMNDEAPALLEIKRSAAAAGRYAVLGARAEALCLAIRNAASQAADSTECIITSDASDSSIKENAGRAAEKYRSIIKAVDRFASVAKSDSENASVCFDLQDLAYELIDAERYICGEESRIDFESEIEEGLGCVIGDPDDLRVSLTCLLDNARIAVTYRLASLANSKRALKYRGKVRLSVSRDGGRIKFAVFDSGFGIDGDVLSPSSPRYVCRPFVSGWPDDGKSHSGLGLAVVRSVAEKNEGSLSLSRVPGGFEAAFYLPEAVLSSMGEGESAGENAQESDSKPSVLVIEDEIMSVGMLREYLESGGYSVCFANDGEEGLLRVRERNFDCILCDYNLPKKNGLDFYRDLQKEAPEVAGRVVFMTGYNVADLIKGVEHKFLFKPIFKRELLEAVNSCVKAGSLQHG